MAKTSTLIQVDYDPFSTNPVDHDPFLDSSRSVYDRVPAPSYITPSSSDTSDLKRDPLKIGPGQETALERAVRVGIEAAGGFDVAKGIAAARQVLPSLQRGDTGKAIGSGLEALGYGTMGLAGMAMPGRGRAAKAAVEAVVPAKAAKAAAAERSSLRATPEFTPAAPAIIGKESTPLFDYSRLTEPHGPQFDLPRYDPPQGVPQRTQDLARPANVERVNDVVRRGLAMGGGGWYGTLPLRERFIEQLGDQEGDRAFRDYMNYVAASSSRSTVPENIRNASYYYSLAELGKPLPETNPAPYGHLAAKAQHRVQAAQFMPGGSGEWNVLRNPKPASFAQNLQGNLQPITIDAHNARIWGLTDTLGRPVDEPRKVNYAYLEDLQQAQAARLSLHPAQYQSAAWVGGGAETGLKSAPAPFLKAFEDRVRFTAGKRGETPQNTLKQFISGKAPLLSVGGAPIFLPGVDDEE